VGPVPICAARNPPRGYEEGRALEVFTRAADGGFGAAQTVAQSAEGVVLAGGPFGAEGTISDTSRNGLWPSIAINSAGEAIAAWVTNTDGSGGGAPAAAIQ
jgi:hypothetical protein